MTEPRTTPATAGTLALPADSEGSADYAEEAATYCDSCPHQKIAHGWRRRPEAIPAGRCLSGDCPCDGFIERAASPVAESGLRRALVRARGFLRQLGYDHGQAGIVAEIDAALAAAAPPAAPRVSILDSDPAALEGNEGWFDEAAPPAAGLDVERLAQAAHNAWPQPGCTASVHDHNWGPDSLYGGFAEQQAAEYARLSAGTDRVDGEPGGATEETPDD